MDHADLIDTLTAMKRQDETIYSTKSGLYDGSRMINGEIRGMMVDWCVRIADFCKFDRDTVSIAINLLDRYVERRQATFLDDQRQFQLVAMTCLYTAIKVHELEAMTPDIVANLSKGVYSAAEIEMTERDILKTIEWRVNPPTAMSFATNYLNLVHHLHPARRHIEDLVHRQIDYALKDDSFLGTSASVIAFASVSNAILSVEPSVHGVSCRAIAQVAGLDSVPSGLSETLSQGCGIETSRPKLVRRLSKRNSSSAVHLSPRCITMERA